MYVKVVRGKQLYVYRLVYQCEGQLFERDIFLDQQAADFGVAQALSICRMLNYAGPHDGGALPYSIVSFS